MSLSDQKKRNIVLKQLTEIPNDAELIFFRSPAEFSRLFYEKINPTHIGLVRGLRSRKGRKKHGNNIIRVCKVKIAGLALYLQDAIKSATAPFMSVLGDNIGALGFLVCFYYICVALLLVAVLVNIPALEAMFTARMIK